MNEYLRAMVNIIALLLVYICWRHMFYCLSSFPQGEDRHLSGRAGKCKCPKATLTTQTSLKKMDKQTQAVAIKYENLQKQ